MITEKTKVLLLCPYPKDLKEGAGGIGSWAKVFVATFPNEEFELYTVNIAPAIFFGRMSRWERPLQGLKTTFRITKEIFKLLKTHPDIKIMHTTTSGGGGSLRDYIVCKICRLHGVKCIMHCRFGTIKEFYESSGFFPKIFRKNLDLYDQIWVLDHRSEVFLQKQRGLESKVFHTPNSIDVPEHVDLQPKSYKRVGFVGNLLQTKGILELTQAVASLDNDTVLIIAGTGPEEIISQIKSIAGSKLGKQIMMLGSIPNKDAVNLIESLDILALPTYYPGEAFPISILEAMSRGKLVVSCPRAAIPDMLLSLDGTLCGLLVEERNPMALNKAIIWCQDHSEEADEMCRKAFEKVRSAYRKEVVYELYRNNYRELLKNNT